MVATLAFDDSGVEYYFENITIPDHFSGWQDEPNWVDVNLAPDSQYCYRVKVRDKSPNHNESAWSQRMCARTLVLPDTTPPTPDPMMWDPNDPNLLPTEIFIGPDPTFGWGITMTSAVATDASGLVEYFFDCVEFNQFDSDWIPTNTYTTGVVGVSGQLLQFRVKARDAYGNETGWSEAIKAYPPGMQRRPEDLPWYLRP